MIKNLEIAALLDVYGQLLTKRQRQVVEDYYNFDLSLGEIAGNYGITRQAVCDALKTGEKALLKYEKLLNLRLIKSEIAKAISADENIRQDILSKLINL